MKKESVESLYRPDFEKRCDEFVAEVKNTIVDKYPNLDIHPVNITRDDLLRFNQKSIKFAEERLGRRSETLRTLDKWKEEESAYQSEGVVDVYGQEGGVAIPQIKEVALKIDEIAKRCGGIKDVIGNEEETLNDQEMPGLYLIYIFK